MNDRAQEEIILIPVKVKLKIVQEDDDEVSIRFDGIEIGNEHEGC